MGWFNRSKSKAPRKPTGGRPAASKPWDPGRTLARLKLVGVITAIALVGFGWDAGRRVLTDYVASTSRGAAGVDDIHLIDAPPWVDAMLRRDLQAIVATRVTGNPMDQASLQRAVDALAANPWIIGVDQARRAPGGHIRVWAQYRQPVAFVQGRDGYHLISDLGVRLPGLYLEHQIAEMGLPLIIGVGAPPPPAGYVWKGGDLRAGLGLIRLVRDEPYIDQVEAFNVAPRDARGRIHLVMRTHNGGAVRWGLPPGEEQPIEPGPSTKMLRMATLQQRFGAIDAGGKVVDIYGPAVFVHQLAEAQADARSAQRTLR